MAGRQNSSIIDSHTPLICCGFICIHFKRLLCIYRKGHKVWVVIFDPNVVQITQPPPNNWANITFVFLYKERLQKIKQRRYRLLLYDLSSVCKMVKYYLSKSQKFLSNKNLESKSYKKFLRNTYLTLPSVRDSFYIKNLQNFIHFPYIPRPLSPPLL